MEIQAGWYPDETQPGFDRYWDGHWWTDETRESATTTATPPAPPKLPNVDSPGESSEPDAAPESLSKTLLTMSVSEFGEAIGGLADRERTYAALLTLHSFESETVRRGRRILVAHEANSGRSVIRPQIQEMVAWQKTQIQRIVSELGVAMREDFEELRLYLGGTFFPISADQAWQNYSSPVKSVVEAIAEESNQMLTQVGNIEDEYLFA
jgi:hypothetical protein